MQQKVEKMIKALFPDAIPGKDFAVKIINGRAAISAWDSVKLGMPPGIEKIHEMYMKYARRRKAVLPGFDASDPLPYLSEEKVRRAVEQPRPRSEVFNGVIFTKVK